MVTGWSDDGQRLVTGSWLGHFRIWDVSTGQPVGAPGKLDADWIHQARFIHEDRRIFLSDLRSAGLIKEGWRHQVPTNQVAVVDSETGEHVFTLSGTNWALTGISGEGRWIAVADQHHVIRLHDALDGRLLAEMRGHTGAIAGLHFNRQGDLLASRAEDRTVRLWQLPSGQPAGFPLAFETPVEQMAFSPDGQLLAVARAEATDATHSTIELWEPNTGVRRERALHIEGRVRILTFAPPESSRLWVATDKDNGVFDVATLDRVRPPLPANGVYSGPWTMSHSGRQVAFGAAKGFLEVWDLDSGDPVYAGNLGGRDLRRLTFSPDGSILLAERDDGAVMLVAQPWVKGVATHRLSASLGEPGHRPRPWLSLDRSRFLLRRDGWFSVLDLDRLSDWEVGVPEIPHRRSGWSAIDPRGNQFAIHYLPLDASGSHFVEVWREAGNGWRRFHLPIPGHPSNFMVFSSDSSRFITMDAGFVRFWNIEEELEERTVSCPEGCAFGMLLPGGEMALMYRPHGKGLALLNFADHTQVELNLKDAVDIQGLAMAPTGDRLAFENANDSDRFVTHILGTRTGEPVKPPLDHGGTLTWVDFSPDGSRVLTAGLTPEVRVWDASTGQPLTRLQLGDQPLRAALWSPDGRFIAARSDDRTVRAWDSATGEAVTPILEHAGDVRYAMLAPTNRLITLSRPDLLSAWELTECDLPLDLLMNYAKLLSGQYLNANGVMLALPPQELAALCRSLRESAPELFK